MMEMLAKRLREYALLFFVIAILLLGYVLYDISFYRHHHLSGWLLFYLLVAQVLYYVQKRSERIRNLFSIQWLPLHVDFGLISVLIFLVHIGWSLPDGSVGLILIGSFAGVALSGWVGLRIKRRYQAALTRRSGREIVFDEIQARMQATAVQADELMLDCAASHQPSMLVDYYRDRLCGAMATPGNLLAQLTGQNDIWLEHFGNIERLIPYLHADEASTARELMRLLRTKNELDYHYAHQGALRIWLLVHVPFTAILLAFTALHILLVYAFSGGA